MKSLRSLFSRKKTLIGGKRPFVADRVKKAGAVKNINWITRSRVLRGGRVVLGDKFVNALGPGEGVHGKIYDLAGYKGEHAANLVVKKYRGPDEWFTTGWG